jgi:hypothetical protein
VIKKRLAESAGSAKQVPMQGTSAHYAHCFFNAQRCA